MPTAGTPVGQDSRDGYPPKIKFLEIILATAKKTAFLTRVQAGCQHRISSFILHPSSFILHPSSFILHPSSFILHPSSFILSSAPNHQPQPLIIDY
jgi:hypothetical protein